MKHFFALLLLCLSLSACEVGFEENREMRSTVYKGQTTWDLYENFGAPTKAIRVADNEFHFIYRREEITRDWTRMFFNWCDMTFIVVNDRVTDWLVEGNQCHVNVLGSAQTDGDDNPRENVVERYQNQGEVILDPSKKSNDDWETLF